MELKEFKNYCKFYNYYCERKKDLDIKIKKLEDAHSEDNSVYGFQYEQRWINEAIENTDSCFEMIRRRCGGRILKLIKAKYVDGLSDEEVGAIANSSYSTVKNEIKKALEKAFS